MQDLAVDDNRSAAWFHNGGSDIEHVEGDGPQHFHCEAGAQKRLRGVGIDKDVRASSCLFDGPCQQPDHWSAMECLKTPRAPAILGCLHSVFGNGLEECPTHRWEISCAHRPYLDGSVRSHSPIISPIMMDVRLVFALGTVGMIEASATTSWSMA